MSAAPDRTLVLLRHAKSDWPEGVGDHARPLAARGRRDAPGAGRWLRDHVGEPGLVLVSGAARTRETWALAQTAGGFVRSEVRITDELYGATPSALLELVRATPDEVLTLLLVGHNPGTEDLADALAGVGSDGAARTDMALKFPTCGIAVIDVPGLWRELRPGSGSLRAFAVPRG